MGSLGVELVAAVDADCVEAVHDGVEAVGVLHKYNYKLLITLLLLKEFKVRVRIEEKTNASQISTHHEKGQG